MPTKGIRPARARKHPVNFPPRPALTVKVPAAQDPNRTEPDPVLPLAAWTLWIGAGAGASATLPARGASAASPPLPHSYTFREIRTRPPLTDDNGAGAQQSDLFLEGDPGVRLPASALAVPHRHGLLSGLPYWPRPARLTWCALNRAVLSTRAALLTSRMRGGGGCAHAWRAPRTVAPPSSPRARWWLREVGRQEGRNPGGAGAATVGFAFSRLVT